MPNKASPKRPAKTEKGKAIPGTKPVKRVKKKLPQEIEWRVFLAPEHPWKTSITLVLLFGVIFLVGTFVYDLLPKNDGNLRILPAVVAGFLSFLLFFASFNNYFLPVRFRLTREEVIIKKFYYTDKREWKMFRRYFLTQSGAVLSTFPTRQRFLDNFRGIQLLLPTDNDERQKVLDFIESKVPLDPGQRRQ